jgi:hypothetical protein
MLFRAGERLSDALLELAVIDSKIERMVTGIAGKSEHGPACTVMYHAINIEIERYNDARDTWVDEIYRIPPKKKPLKEPHGQV